MHVMSFNDAELEIFIDALGRLREVKVEALDTAKESRFPFTPHDFGIPQIDGLLERVETEYNRE
jgi:hypothetical protein